MTKSEILDVLVDNTHTLFTTAFLDEANAAFSLAIKPRRYEADPTDPKGLTLDNGADAATGITAFDLAPAICKALGVAYEAKHGRGFQVRACVLALRTAGHD